MRTIVATVAGTAVLAIGVVAAAALGSGSTVTTASSQATTAPPAKVWLCHHTGSWKHPYHLIHVSTHAVRAHQRHGDVDPGSGNSCPSAQPAGAKSHGSDQSSKNKPETPEKDDDAND